MFKRSEPQAPRTDQLQTQTQPSSTAPIDREPQQPRIQAIIGATIRIKGDVTGEENLTIDGTVDGTVTVKQHSLQVGKNGRLNADVFAKVIRIEGHVEGNIHAEEQVLVRASGVVRGNIVSPRLTMEDGCSFKGSVDMESKSAKSQGDSGRKSAPMGNGASNGAGNGADVAATAGIDRNNDASSARAG